MLKLFHPRFKGLMLDKKVGRNFYFHIGKETTLEHIKTFITKLPLEYEFSFFDNFHPTISDPGAYCDVQKFSINSYAYMLGNLGWTTAWVEADATFIAEYLFKNREFNKDNLYACKWIKRAQIGKRLGEY